MMNTQAVLAEAIRQVCDAAEGLGKLVGDLAAIKTAADAATSLGVQRTHTPQQIAQITANVRLSEASRSRLADVHLLGDPVLLAELSEQCLRTFQRCRTLLRDVTQHYAGELVSQREDVIAAAQEFATALTAQARASEPPPKDAPAKK